MTLRERCRKFLIETIVKSHGGDLVAEMMVPHLEAFVVAETGRAAGGDALDKALPLCLYFQSERDREEFIAMVELVKPNLVTKRMP